MGPQTTVPPHSHLLACPHPFNAFAPLAPSTDHNRLGVVVTMGLDSVDIGAGGQGQSQTPRGSDEAGYDLLHGIDSPQR